MISRIPTLSLKTIRVPVRAVAPLLVLVGLLAAAVITYPVGTLVFAMVVYLLHIPFSVRRYYWLAKHPEAWAIPPRERRAIRRASTARRLGLRPPLRRVAGAARRAVRMPRTRPVDTVLGPQTAPFTIRRGWRRIGLRRDGIRRAGPRPGERRSG